MNTPGQAASGAATGFSSISWEQPRRFLACRGELDEATAVIFGAPLDATISYRPGARFGPARIREVSGVLEEYSPILDADLCSARVCDIGDIVLPLGNVPAALGMIEACVRGIVRLGPVPVMLGGEHLVTLAAVKAVASQFPGLKVVHLDAHADTREEYLGERLSHATVMRRVGEIVGRDNVFHLGIRSGTREEYLDIAEGRLLSGDLKDSLASVVDMLGASPAYVTVDIDVLDPAYAPGTGTPEPGGATSGELLGAVSLLKHLNVAGFDLVEVAPPYDHSDITAIAAAKVVREVVLALELRRRGRGA